MSRLHIFRWACVLALATIVHAQTYNVIYNFGSRSGDASNPRYSGTIIQSHGGYLLSTTDDFWTDGIGSVFRKSPSGPYTVLHRFNGTDGMAPVGGLTLGTDGNFYGTAQTGGTHGFGTVFRMSPQGGVTTLYNFTGGGDGAWPTAAPIQSMGGDFYGTTVGQDGHNGSVYKITRAGTFTLLHTFVAAEGMNPYAPLVQKADGYFYGTTFNGGTFGYGTIFRISASGTFKVLFHFDGTRGGHPYAPLLEASNGMLYGVATSGGVFDVGTVFKMDSSHAVTRLWSFTGGMDGSNPVGGLMEATDGYIYGTNNLGGDWGWGVLFRMSKAGAFTRLRSFDWDSGASPQAALFQHTDGRLYGTTAVGGTQTVGTIYRYDLGLSPFVSFQPVGGRSGQRIHILGQGFTGTTAVAFNGVPAQFTVSLPTYLTAVVPAGATTGYITVTTPTGVLSSNKKFLVWK